jgi:hypothetical protein
MHGKASDIHHDGSGVFAGLPSPFSAIRYHSLCAAPEAVPDALEVTARTNTGVIMAVKHREYPVHGVQFHPESILSEHGKDLLRNFLRSSDQSHPSSPPGRVVPEMVGTHIAAGLRSDDTSTAPDLASAARVGSPQVYP